MQPHIAGGVAFFGIALAMVFYGVIFFVVWKFYQVLSKISDNIGGIKRALDRNSLPQGT